MKHIWKRILVCFLTMTLVLSMGNGYGITFVYASENTESVQKDVQKQQTIPATTPSVSGTVKGSSNSAETISSSQEITSPIDYNVIIDGESSNITVNFTGINITGNVTIKMGMLHLIMYL